MPKSNFSQATLIQVNFAFANLKEAIFDEANIALANLSYANLENAIIIETQLREAISIRGTRLPDGSIGNYTNLLSNGHADCNRSLNRDWKVDSITVSPLDQTSNNCVFIKNSNDSGVSTMSQEVYLGFSILVLVNQGQGTAVLRTIRSTSNITLSLTAIGVGSKILEKRSMGK
jgi:uncharacterized protein YjbI with pentapeptide repeats